MTEPECIVRQMALGPMVNFVYLLGCAATREAAVIDPAWDVPAVFNAARRLNLNIRHVLLTHAHPDHINGLAEVMGATDSIAWMNTVEIRYMREMAARFQIPVDFIDRLGDRMRGVVDQEEIRVGDVAVRCLHTPGHTPGSHCFLAGGMLFSGDTLFIDACGRVDLPGGDPMQMWHSLNRKLRELPDEVVLYPGHDYSGRASCTMGEQKRTNPYLQFETADAFLRMMGR